ncbi:MAG: flagellar hook-length control protein FliK, partial [Spirochaetia bacterium]
AAVAVSAESTEKKSADNTDAAEKQSIVQGEKTNSNSKATGKGRDGGEVGISNKTSGEKTKHVFEARVSEDGKREAVEKGGKEKLLGKQEFVVDRDSSKDANSLDSRELLLKHGKGTLAESIAVKERLAVEAAEDIKTDDATSKTRAETDSAQTQRKNQKADALARLATTEGRDEKAERVAAASAGSVAGDKPEGENGGARLRNRNELVVDLSKYDTKGESDKTGNNQSGGESRGGEQDARNSFASRLEGFGGNDSSTGRSGTTGSDFASQLSRRLQGDAGAEIVRHAHMVVRGKESGDMRLVLRPDNLGSVRVRMQMEDGLITVRFLVENNGVRQALEQNLVGLQQAFKDAGLETGGLEVSVGNGGNSDTEQHDHGDTTRRDIHRLAAAVPGVSEFGFSEHAVDLIA